MISYSTCTAALLALAEINTIAAIRSNDYDKRHGLRKLYYSEGQVVTDVQTKCDQVIEGNPKRCMIVCVEVTSVKDGDELVDEYSKVSQRKCEDGWEHDGHDGDDDDWKGHAEWPMYSPTTQFPTYYPTELVDDGHKTDTEWTGVGHERVVDWTDDGWTSYYDESQVSEGSKGGKSGGYSKGSKTGHSKSSKSKAGYSKSSKSNGSKGGSYSKSSKEYYVGNLNGGEGSGYSKSNKSSGADDVGDWDATILESIPDEWEAASWSGGAGVIEGSGSSKSSKTKSDSWSSGASIITGGKVSGSSKSSKSESLSWSSGAASSGKSSKLITESASWSGGVGGSSKSSKPESLSWSGGAGVNEEGNGLGSSKSSKLAGDSNEWESAKWSGGGLIEGDKGSGSSKSSKPAGGSGDVIDGKGSIPKTVSERESDSWSGGGAL